MTPHTTHYEGCECFQEKLKVAIEALENIADVTSAFNPQIGRVSSYADWELRAIAREALKKLKGEG